MPSEELIENKFGVQTIFALRHTGEICGSNGLPLTPKSIDILGRAQLLKTLKHSNIASYLDFIRGKHERLFLVLEYYNRKLNHYLKENDCDIIKIAYQIVQGLIFLNNHGIVHRMMSLNNILLNEKNDVKLLNFGLYYITNNGKDVEFPIGSIKYTAPEVLLSVFNPHYVSGPKVDVWSLGIILTELVFKKQLWHTLKLGQCLRKVLSLIYCEDVLSRLARESDSLSAYEKMDPDLKNFIEVCLHTDLRKRQLPEELLKHKLFDKVSFSSHTYEKIFQEDNKHPLNSWELHELYHLWQLTGGDIHSELKKNGLIKNRPPILSIPNLILLEGMSFGRIKDTASILDLKIVPLNLQTLITRLNHIDFNFFFPLIESKINNFGDIVDSSEIGDKISTDLPLVIRERDTEYQFHKILLFRRLLKGYPYTKERLYEEARKDIPPYFRGEIWAALLEVKGDIETRYTAIDKETPIPTDRQIEVDIPRCHQYNELLSSKSGHMKLKRILKAWVISNQQYVYWQGLDSLCSPFLYLNFNNEGRAYGCFSAFIPKYLHNFFLRDNSAVIKEYLLKFSHLIAFHDPVLAVHLHNINFVPELFAIPWFLTMFAHVFPLHKIFHLWDKLLLGDTSYPLFIGLAILHQLRDTLLASGFNECILLFSDLPEIDIGKCVVDSNQFYSVTPRSITIRKYQSHAPSTSHFTITDEMLMEISKEFNPRLSVLDFLQLINAKETRSSILIIDARPNFEYKEKAIPGSINLPFSSIDFSKSICEGISSSPELSILINNKGKLIVVIGKIISEAAEISRYLTVEEFAKVCILNGGIDNLLFTGLLVPFLT